MCDMMKYHSHKPSRSKRGPRSCLASGFDIPPGSCSVSSRGHGQMKPKRTVVVERRVWLQIEETGIDAVVRVRKDGRISDLRRVENSVLKDGQVRIFSHLPYNTQIVYTTL